MVLLSTCLLFWELAGRVVAKPSNYLDFKKITDASLIWDILDQFLAETFLATYFGFDFNFPWVDDYTDGDTIK
jgi:hypothetical protein